MRLIQYLMIGSLILPILVAEKIQTAGQDTDEVQATEARRLIAQEIGKFKMRSGVGEKATALQRSDASILRWTNPSLGTIYGDVFVWTKNGRAEAVGSIFKFYSPFTNMSIEFQSFSKEPLEADYDGTKIWTPKAEDVKFVAMTDAPEPSKAKFARLSQMRSLAGAFSVDATQRRDESITRRLRMLPQPIFRYDSSDPEVLDGAIFAFVEGTDPELLILIEARKSKNGFTWHYTIGRMNSIQFEVRRKDEVVWKGAKLAPPWPNVRNPEKSYFHFGLGNVSVPQVREEGTSNENRVSEPTEN